MARRGEVEIVRPRKAIAALEGFNNDIVVLLAAVRNAISFLDDKTLDAERTRKVVADSLKEPMNKVSRWYDAE